MRRIILSFVLFSVFSVLLCHAQSYEQMSKMNIGELVSVGTEQLTKVNKPKQALMAFNIAMGKYRQDLTDEDKRQCMKACYGAWLVYFNYYCNYQKAFESIMLARDIADNLHQNEPKIYLLAGNIYQTMSEQNRDNRLMRRAYTYYYKALMMALDSRDQSSVDICFSNLLTSAHSLDSINGVEKAWKVYSSLPVEKQNVRRIYNHEAYRMYLLWHKKLYSQAIAVAEKLIRVTPATGEYVRLLVNAWLIKARLLYAQGDRMGALQSLNAPARLARQFSMKDAMLEIYGLKAQILKSDGRSAEASDNYEKYLALKDSLYISRQLSNIDEMQFGYDLKKKDENLRTATAQRQLLMVISVALMAIALMLVVMLLVIKAKNRKLRESNRQLYLKSVAQLKSDANERILTHKYEQEISNLQKNMSVDSEQGRQRYKGSGLSENDKGLVLAQIKKVMENVDEFCSPDFSVARLSSLAGYKQKEISEVIHDFYNCNFNVFLNEYRIREACRRVVENNEFTRLTIQGMANSVGFRSRSAFIAAFKRFAGLTPSEYIRLSAQERMQGA